MGRYFSNICKTNHVFFLYCNKQNGESNALQKAIQLWEELPTQGNKKYCKILILFPALTGVYVGVGVGGIQATAIFSEFFYPFSICIQLDCSSNNFSLFFNFCKHLQKILKFVRGLSKITHMYVKQILTLSSEFSVNYHLAIAGNACED